MDIYRREIVSLDELLLDIENPRFSSYFERIGKDCLLATQDDVFEYLCKYESINVLAERIKEVGGLHPTELVACIETDNNTYVVLEGNRRVCACKNLANKYSQSNEFSDLLNNISRLEVVVYKTRELAQPYINDKHIDGVKKWESIEKSCYYYRMFQEKRQRDASLSSDIIVDEIVKQTTSKKAEVRDCIIKYGFYMSVYEALTEEHSREALVDTNSFLPLVDRFMKILVSTDVEVGLGLPLVELSYVAHNGKEEMFKATPYNEPLQFLYCNTKKKSTTKCPTKQARGT